MLDFLVISTRLTKSGTEIFPKFRTYPKSHDLMLRGGDFYAVWDEEAGLWSTDENALKQMIDSELTKYYEEHKNQLFNPCVKYMWDSDSGSIDRWHKFCQKQMRDSYESLDEKLIFSNDGANKKDYASKRLNYPLEPGSITAFDKIMSTLYSDGERHKIEWAIGSIVTGDSKTIQKFMVLYGDAGSGKSTVMNIIQMLFDGYYTVFDARELGSANAQFSLEAFKNNPLVAIQHDGDLSKIEDNTRLNSLVSHEEMMVNEKYTKRYKNRFKCFLFMGSNKPVKITDSRSGLMRRLIDVEPSGKRLTFKEYTAAMKQIPFELGAIACHCRDVYLDDPNFYDDYTPLSMMSATNDFYNFMVESFLVFKRDDGTTLKAAWEMYKTYCEEAKVPYPMSQRNFKEELKSYFEMYEDRIVGADGGRLSNYFSGFKVDKFDMGRGKKKKKEEPRPYTIDFKEGIQSAFDIACASCFAQYASSNETPKKAWDAVKTLLSVIDTHRLHYVKVPENHIIIDFDIKDENGEKSFEKNLEEASKWPATYAELSKSGGGIHLHYIYTGDVSKLSRVYEENIEVKVFTGKSSLRRKLTKCNDLPIATISSGLPLKEEGKMVSKDVVKTEKGLRTTIMKCINKEIHASTKCSMDFIYKILEDAYNDGLHYDVSDMENLILAFAAGSTNQSDYCVSLMNKMHFKSEEASEPVDAAGPIIFYDVEVFPNLFLVNWKIQGEGKPVVRMINPKRTEIEELLKYRLVGFNNRDYDNHMIYACLMGYTPEQIYDLSQRIIVKKDRTAKFQEAYNLSYTDVYDFSAKKQSLKKWEIELGIHHQELGLPWDQPVPEERWVEVAEYCDNDVLATEAVFNHLQADFVARQILADLAGMTVNDTTNTLTQRIIFGSNRKPQDQFRYRNLAEPVHDLTEEERNFLEKVAPEMVSQTHGEAGSLLPYFPGYEFDKFKRKSTYKGVEVGEGGRVNANPGIHTMVALLDITSMHPHSAMLEIVFGTKFTRIFYELVYARVHIKHKEWDIVNSILDGKLAQYVQKVISGEMSAKQLSNALKIVINSVYGLTSASFPNAFKDPRNIDNIVAKRGALFMIDLQEAVEAKGYTVAHIKTDSIKIPNATPEIIKFVMDFGAKYGYTFEHEATYSKMCLVNDAVYIAQYASAEDCEKMYGYIPGDNAEHPGDWTATGTQFQVPYVFKTLFSKEPIVFEDMCETKSVTTALYLDMNEHLDDVTADEKELEKYEKRYKEGKLSDISFEKTSNDLVKRIEAGHDYKFVGRVGNFCPIKRGKGGGLLVREKDGKYSSATGAKGYRWLESELIRHQENARDLIDRAYYDTLVDKAVEAISEYGDFEWFVSDDPVGYPPPDFMNIPEGSPEEVPFN